MAWLSLMTAATVWAFAHSAFAAETTAKPPYDKILDEYPIAEKRVTRHPLQDALDAAEKGDLFAQRYVAHALEYAREAWLIFDEPAIWYRRAAEHGNAVDIRELACFTYRHDENDARRQKAAADGMKKAADSGDIWAAVYFSRFARLGYGMAANAAEAERYLEGALTALRKEAKGNIESEVWDELRERRCGPDDEPTADRVLSTGK